MARINIDDDLFGGGGFIGLLSALKDEEKAMGKILKAYRAAQGYWVKGELVPEGLWKALDLEILIDCDLATRKPTGIYVHGSEKSFDWLLQKSKAGIASGEARRKKSEVFKQRSNDVGQKGTSVEHTFGADGVVFEQNGNGSEALYSSLFTHSIHTQPETVERPERISQENLILMFNRICAGQGKIRAFSGYDLPREALVDFLNRSGKPEWCNSEDWENFFSEVAASDYLTGKNEVGFVASLPWILKPDKFENIIAGLHGNRDPKFKTSKQAHSDSGAKADALFDRIIRTGRYAFKREDYTDLEMSALQNAGGLASIMDCTDFNKEKIKAQFRAAYKQAFEELGK